VSDYDADTARDVRGRLVVQVLSKRRVSQGWSRLRLSPWRSRLEVSRTAILSIQLKDCFSGDRWEQDGRLIISHG
jgi:hypothetical protein